MLCGENMKIAALFVETDGCYFGLDNVDPWDKERDARLYTGPYPVIAHPPCQLWGKMAKINYSRWGGEHNKPGNDGGCFKSALYSVNKFGGVLEHPAQTYAWETFCLTKPKKNCWTKSGYGWVCEVWQSAYGHKANKATWLYYRGSQNPPELDWSRPAGEFQIGFQDQRGKKRNKPTLNKKQANATPERFRDLLIDIAMIANKKAIEVSSKGF